MAGSIEIVIQTQTSIEVEVQNFISIDCEIILGDASIGGGVAFDGIIDQVIDGNPITFVDLPI